MKIKVQTLSRVWSSSHLNAKELFSAKQWLVLLPGLAAKVGLPRINREESRTILVVSKPYRFLDSAPARDQVENQNDHGNDQQYMNQAAAYVTQESQ
jgi:hypothetical protein